MKFHFIFLLLIDGSSFCLGVFPVLYFVDDWSRTARVFDWKQCALFTILCQVFIINISVISVKASIISENIRCEISANVFFTDSVFESIDLNLCYYLTVRYFSSQRAWKIILQSLRLPFNLCTSSEEMHFRDVFPFSCLIRLNWFFRRSTPFWPAKRLFRLTGKSSSGMSDASSLQDFSKIFSLPSSESLVESSYPESLSKKFSFALDLELSLMTKTGFLHLQQR